MGQFSLSEYDKFPEKGSNSCFWYYQLPQSAEKSFLDLEVEEWKAPDSLREQQTPLDIPSVNQNNSEDEDLMEITYEKIEELEERMQLISKKHLEPLNQITPFPRKKLCKDHESSPEHIIDFNTLPPSYSTSSIGFFSNFPDKEDPPSPSISKNSKELLKREFPRKTTSNKSKMEARMGYLKNELQANLPGHLGRYTILTEPSFNSDITIKPYFEQRETTMDTFFSYQCNTS